MPAGRLDKEFAILLLPMVAVRCAIGRGAAFAATDGSRSSPPHWVVLHPSQTPFEQALFLLRRHYGTLVNGFTIEGICEVSGKGGNCGVPTEGVLLCYMSIRSKVASLT